MKERIRQYFLGVLISIDQLCNALIGGDPDETLSARAYRTESDRKILGRIFRPLIDFLFSGLEEEHCRKSYVSEKVRAHLHESYQLKKVEKKNV